MARFRYKAVGPDGEVIEGEMEAADRSLVIARLQADQHLPIHAREIGADERPPGSAARLLAALSKPLPRSSRLRQRDAGRFARSLATLLGAGLALDRALSVMQEVAGPGRERDLVRFTLERVRGGAALSATMAERPELFGRFAVSLVRAGEASGQVAGALERLASHQERAREVMETVRSALIYPIVLLLVAAASVALLLVFVIPQFQDLFEGASRELPLSTRVVFGMADALRDWGWLLLLLGLAGWLGLNRWRATPEGRLALDGWQLRLPLIGPLLVKLETERLMRSLATLVGSGVGLPAALALAAEAIGNQVMVRAARDLSQRVTEGASFSRMLADSGLFPPLAVQLARVGEETGKLPAMLLETAEIYSGEVQVAVKRLLTLIEPVMIVGLGVVVAGIILSVLAAILGLNALAL